VKISVNGSGNFNRNSGDTDVKYLFIQETS